MNIQNVSSMNGIGYHLNYSNEPIDRVEQARLSSQQYLNDFITPEQKQAIAEAVKEKQSQQQDEMKSNYQTAKDIELAQAYYQQQQKVIDTYMQASSDKQTSSSSDINALSLLTDYYIDKYHRHNDIKDSLNELGELIAPPAIMPYVSEQTSVVNQQKLAAYQSITELNNQHYLHLSV